MQSQASLAQLRHKYPAYKHVTLAEIFEEPKAMKEAALREAAKARAVAKELVESGLKLAYIVGSGASLNAAMAGQYALTGLAGISATAISASEFPEWLPRKPRPSSALIALSRSGETPEVLKSAKLAKELSLIHI